MVTTPALTRQLGFWAVTSVVVGTMIGSGIFRVPSAIAADVGSPSGVLAVWVLGGLISLCGALALAELAAAFPRPGGVFVYLHEVYGPATAFVFGWTMLVIAPASTAAVSLVFAEYLGTIVPLTLTGTRMVAVAAVLVVSAASYRSVQGSGAIQSVSTAGKVAALSALVLAAFVLGNGSTGTFAGSGSSSSGTLLGGFGVALVSVLWAYNGFNDMVCIAGEARDPSRVLPRALLVGTLTVIVIYVAANVAFLYVLPFAALVGSPLVASDVATRLVGPSGASAVAIMVMVSTFGAVNGLMLTQPRIFYGMAAEGLLFRSLARVHPRYRTPHVAIVLYTAVTLLCVWSRSFEQLAEAFVLGTWPFLALAVAGVIRLRRLRPSLERPYRTPGYPVVPVVFIVGTAWVVVSALIARPATTLAGIGLTLAGLPVYWVWRRSGLRKPDVAVSGFVTER
jgi:basic amino acid/polyamine antiporter, APA family